jgi:hypothetical protein
MVNEHLPAIGAGLNELLTNELKALSFAVFGIILGQPVQQTKLQ